MLVLPIKKKWGYRKDCPSFIAECSLSVGTGREEWGAKKIRNIML